MSFEDLVLTVQREHPVLPDEKATTNQMLRDKKKPNLHMGGTNQETFECKQDNITSD